MDYSPITDRDFDLPGGENVAVWVIPNVEHFRFDSSRGGIAPPRGTPDTMNFGWKDYGLRVGIWRLVDVLDRHSVPATYALNSDVCTYEPEIVEAAVERDWAIMGHGTTNSETLSDLSEDEERDVIRTTRDRIFDLTGEKPAGWLGPALQETYNTPDILAEEGFTYVCDWCNDDQPYPMNVRDGDLISVPYSVEINDYQLILKFGLTGPDYERLVKDQFDVLYREGREPGNAKVMAISLHTFIFGQAFRSKYLERVLEYISNHRDVWLTTGDEIATYYYENYY